MMYLSIWKFLSLGRHVGCLLLLLLVQNNVNSCEKELQAAQFLTSIITTSAILIAMMPLELRKRFDYKRRSKLWKQWLIPENTSTIGEFGARLGKHSLWFAKITMQWVILFVGVATCCFT
jgi:hypothetical protein